MNIRNLQNFEFYSSHGNYADFICIYIYIVKCGV